MTHSISRRYLSAARGFFRLVVLAAFASLTIFAHHPIARADDQDGGDVRIMTQNMDQGTDFTEVLSATTPAQFFAAVTTTYQNIQATKPAERAAALAHEIAANHPDLVALQEPAILRTGTGTTPATNVISDQLALLIAALAKLGQPYETVAIIPNIDAEAPSTLGFDVRITARTVIIAKNEDVSAGLALSNVQVQEFLVNQSSPTAVGISVPDLRGWASVDVKVHGRMFRFVTNSSRNNDANPSSCGDPTSASDRARPKRRKYNLTDRIRCRFQCFRGRPLGSVLRDLPTPDQFRPGRCLATERSPSCWLYLLPGPNPPQPSFRAQSPDRSGAAAW